MRLRITDARRAAIEKRALDKIPASLASSPGVTAAHEGAMSLLEWTVSVPELIVVVGVTAATALIIYWIAGRG